MDRSPLSKCLAKAPDGIQHRWRPTRAYIGGSTFDSRPPPLLCCWPVRQVWLNRLFKGERLVRVSLPACPTRPCSCIFDANPPVSLAWKPPIPPLCRWVKGGDRLDRTVEGEGGDNSDFLFSLKKLVIANRVSGDLGGPNGKGGEGHGLLT